MCDAPSKTCEFKRVSIEIKHRWSENFSVKNQLSSSVYFPILIVMKLALKHHTLPMVRRLFALAVRRHQTTPIDEFHPDCAAFPRDGWIKTGMNGKGGIFASVTVTHRNVLSRTPNQRDVRSDAQKCSPGKHGRPVRKSHHDVRRQLCVQSGIFSALPSGHVSKHLQLYIKRSSWAPGDSRSQAIQCRRTPSPMWYQYFSIFSHMKHRPMQTLWFGTPLGHQ